MPINYDLKSKLPTPTYSSHNTWQVKHKIVLILTNFQNKILKGTGKYAEMIGILMQQNINNHGSDPHNWKLANYENSSNLHLFNKNGCIMSCVSTLRKQSLACQMISPSMVFLGTITQFITFQFYLSYTTSQLWNFHKITSVQSEHRRRRKEERKREKEKYCMGYFSAFIFLIFWLQQRIISCDYIGFFVIASESTYT
jgi:hypothetical protein